MKGLRIRSCLGPTRVGLAYKTGDLVHIPQAVTLVQCPYEPPEDPQLTIPLSFHETDRPEIALVVDTTAFGYVRVLWSGKTWSVKDDSVYGVRS
jgi:hypothetical protein